MQQYTVAGQLLSNAQMGHNKPVQLNLFSTYIGTLLKVIATNLSVTGVSWIESTHTGPFSSFVTWLLFSMRSGYSWLPQSGTSHITDIQSFKGINHEVVVVNVSLRPASPMQALRP
jgi:hypothetical protein